MDDTSSGYLFVLIVFGVGLLIYMIPTVVAFARRHPSRWAILVINAAFGGTIIGWLGPLVWAMGAVHRSPTRSDGGESGLNLFINDPVSMQVKTTMVGTVSVGFDDIVLRLRQVKQLADSGDITSEEHAVLRGRIINQFEITAVHG